MRSGIQSKREEELAAALANLAKRDEEHAAVQALFALTGLVLQWTWDEKEHFWRGTAPHKLRFPGYLYHVSQSLDKTFMVSCVTPVETHSGYGWGKYYITEEEAKRACEKHKETGWWG